MSSDAIAMGVGLLFGALPLLLLAFINRGRVDEAPPVIVDNPASTCYTAAHPFAIAPATPPVIVVNPPADGDCPDWCEPWIWEELYEGGRTAPPHRTLQDRRYAVVPLDVATYDGAYPFGPLVDVQRTTIQDGVWIEENHLLPAEVAARLFGEVQP